MDINHEVTKRWVIYAAMGVAFNGHKKGEDTFDG